MTVFDPDSDNLPKLSELEPIPDAPKYAAWFWGKDDQVKQAGLCLCTTSYSFLGANSAR